MVMDRLAEAAREAERKFGLPPISKFAESLDRLPDSQQLKLIKEVLAIAERVSQSAPELDQVISLIREINNVPLDKLERLEKILKRVDKILKNAPQDLLSFLTGLKEE